MRANRRSLALPLAPSRSLSLLDSSLTRPLRLLPPITPSICRHLPPSPSAFRCRPSGCRSSYRATAATPTGPTWKPLTLRGRKQLLARCVGSRLPLHFTRSCSQFDSLPLTYLTISSKQLPYHSEVCRANVDIEVATTNAAKGKTPAPGGAGVDQTFAKQMTRQVHMLPVKTLRTIMHELGHAHVDLLKLDVEGSEYAFLESAIDDFDCPPLAQFSVEWHHHVFDSRYVCSLLYYHSPFFQKMEKALVPSVSVPLPHRFVSLSTGLSLHSRCTPVALPSRAVGVRNARSGCVCRRACRCACCRALQPRSSTSPRPPPGFAPSAQIRRRLIASGERNRHVPARSVRRQALAARLRPRGFHGPPPLGPRRRALAALPNFELHHSQINK